MSVPYLYYFIFTKVVICIDNANIMQFVSIISIFFNDSTNNKSPPRIVLNGSIATIARTTRLEG